MAEPSTSNFPSALDDDTSLGGDQVNIKSFTLGSSIGSAETSIPANAAISGVTAPFYLLAESELIYVEGVSGSDFTPAVRGADGTTAASHTSGITLYVVYAANLFNQLKRAIVAIETEIGINASQTKFNQGHLWGLTLSNNTTDATNDIDIAVGEAKDGDNTEDMILASALTKQLDAAWAVGTNQGMLDTGTIADTTYHIFLIKRTDTNVVDILASLSATSPTMPTNYDKKRRIGSIVRTGAAIKAFVQDGDYFMLKTPARDINATNPGIAAVTRTLGSIPTGIRVRALLSVVSDGVNSAGSPGAIYISDLSTTDVAAAYAGAFSVYGFLATATHYDGAEVNTVFTNTSAQVRSRVEVSDATTHLGITTRGWVDTRGRLA